MKNCLGILKFSILDESYLAPLAFLIELKNIPISLHKIFLNPTYVMEFNLGEGFQNQNSSPFSGLLPGGLGGHDPPNEIDFAPARSATKPKVVQTLAQCPPPVFI